jgi:hypothetical protein
MNMEELFILASGAPGLWIMFPIAYVLITIMRFPEKRSRKFKMMVGYPTTNQTTAPPTRQSESRAYGYVGSERHYVR